MKITLLIIQLLLLQNYCSAQKSENNNNDTTIKFCGGSSPIYVLNGKRISTVFFENEYGNDTTKKMGAVLIEGDSIHMKKTGNEESILKKYFGDEVKNGVLLFFTPEVVTTLSGRSMKTFLKENTFPTLWSVNGVGRSLTLDSSVINYFGIRNITRIEVIKNIGFKNKDGSYDFFNVVLVYLKRKFLLNFYK